MSYRVRLSDGALENIVLAAAEAYCLGDGDRPRSIETLGYMWGSSRKARDVTEIYIERVSVSISAQRHRNWVQPNNDAARFKNEIVQRWSPHLQLLGDFHSHPYKTRAEVEDQRGYEFSDGDFDAFMNDDFLWTESEIPVMLVATVARLGRVHQTEGPRMVRANVVRFDIGELRFWLNVAIGFRTGELRDCTRNGHSPVIIDVGPRLFNFAGDRVAP